MPRNRSCLSFSAIPWIDRAPVTPLDPIACTAVVVRSEGQGRRRVFQRANSIFSVSRLENVCRRRSLAFNQREHDGRLTSVRDGGPCAAVAALMAILCAIMITTALSANAIADERDIGTPGSSAVAVSPTQNLSSVRSSVGTSVANLWVEHIAEAAHRFAIPERWIRAVMTAESHHDPHAISPKGAMGLMQIMPVTWQELRARHGLGDDPYDPRDNILAGAAYLSELHDLYGSPGFLAAYNAGPGRYEQHLATGAPLPAETRAYVAKVAPQIDANAAVALHRTGRPAHDEWSAAPLFVGRLTPPSGDKQAAKHPPSVRQANGGKITDLSALAPASFGLFITRSRHGVAE